MGNAFKIACLYFAVFCVTFGNLFKLIEALMFSEISILSEKLVTAYIDVFYLFLCFCRVSVLCLSLFG